MIRVLHAVGTRPNFSKAAPVIRALNRYPQITQLLIHTGQHYDKNMSEVFFEQLGLPRPHANLEVGSGTHAEQTAKTMERLEPVIVETKPDVAVVYGDVNSTVAASLVCAKLEVKIAHVEAGLRSFDRSPEEINRIVTDRLADLLFTPSFDADEELIREGVDRSKIFMVGNVMIDSLIECLQRVRKPALDSLPERYAVATLHRPANVDDPEKLAQLIDRLEQIAREVPIIFPVHPRTRARIEQLNGRVHGISGGLHLVEPLGYLEFLALQRDAVMIITDSGGIQGETTFLKVPCLTLLEKTPWRVTISAGSNIVIGDDLDRLVPEARRVLNGWQKPDHLPPLWDGHSGERIAEILAHYLSQSAQHL